MYWCYLAAIPGIYCLTTQLCWILFNKHHIGTKGDLPGGSSSKESACNVGDPGLIPGSGKERQPTPVFLLGEFHGQRSLVGLVYSAAKSQTKLSD